MAHPTHPDNEQPSNDSITISRKEFLKAGLGAAGFMTLAASGLKAFAGEYTPTDPQLQQRVKKLIDKMTLEEKISQLRYDAPAIDRLDIPAYNWWNECLHGVARAGYATVFPQAIGMAASWNTDLMHEVATAISDEARAKHHAFAERGHRGIYMGLTFWTPNINIVRDPRWGRGQETYGEDPHLTGQLANAFITGLQGDHPEYYKVIATSKHFAVYNGPEPLRHEIDVQVSDKDLWETYLPAFETTVKDAKVASVMCAYNSLNGTPCCGSSPLQEDILRNRWNFDGYIVSDCWAVADFYEEEDHNVVDTPEEAAAMAINNGTDLNCGNTYPHMQKAVDKGLVSENVIDQALMRLFEARFKLGMFDNPEKVPFTNIPYSVVDNEEHRTLAHRVARESMVLLKNEPAGENKPVLPLSKDLDSIAVIGPNADDFWTMLGNYHGTPKVMSTPLDGIKAKVGSGTDVHYAPGSKMAGGLPRMEVITSDFLQPKNGEGNGLTAEYFDNAELKGEPAITRTDETVDFIWLDDTPVTGKMADEFSARWTGTLTPPKSGTYLIGLRGYTRYKVTIDGTTIAERENFGSILDSNTIKLKAGQSYDLNIEYESNGLNPYAQLLWEIPGQDLKAEAVEVAEQSDAVVLCLGLNADIEGEEMDIDVEGFKGGDRTELDLPDTQVELMKEIQSLGKPVVLVLIAGSTIAVPWAQQNVPAIVQAWYGGQAGGDGLADMLFGDYNPAGRLPVTCYKSTDDLPEFTDYSMKNRTYKYFEGEVLYPFGHGLSYTQFGYSDLNLPETYSAGQPLKLAVTLSNTGDLAGDEVVQVYVSHLDVNGQNPKQSLVAFERHSLAAGSSRKLSVELSPEQLQWVDEEGQKNPPKGRLKISVGGKQPQVQSVADHPTTEVVEQVVEVVN